MDYILANRKPIDLKALKDVVTISKFAKVEIIIRGIGIKFKDKGGKKSKIYEKSEVKKIKNLEK